MWQRKQTIFLAVTGACMVLMTFFPAWVSELDGIRHELSPFYYSRTEAGIDTFAYYPYCISAILAIAAATIAFLEIGKFENRMTQIKMGALNSLVMAGSITALVIFATQLIKSTQVSGHYGLALWLPAGAMISNMIANRFIRRDEKLVRDADRIR